jgi:hypothetical protein
MEKRARLSWRLPPRLRRIRLVWPELAGMGATPASIANASADRKRRRSPASPTSLAVTRACAGQRAERVVGNHGLDPPLERPDLG